MTMSRIGPGATFSLADALAFQNATGQSAEPYRTVITRWASISPNDPPFPPE
jgi:hypothetical protein